MERSYLDGSREQGRGGGGIVDVGVKELAKAPKLRSLCYETGLSYCEALVHTNTV